MNVLSALPAGKKSRPKCALLEVIDISIHLSVQIRQLCKRPIAGVEVEVEQRASLDDEIQPNHLTTPRMGAGISAHIDNDDEFHVLPRLHVQTTMI